MKLKVLKLNKLNVVVKKNLLLWFFTIISNLTMNVKRLLF